MEMLARQQKRTNMHSDGQMAQPSSIASAAATQELTPKKIVTIGSGLIDVFITSDTFELDAATGTLTCSAKSGKLEVDSFAVHTGGGATNTAVGFARLGFQVSCIAELGRDEQAHLVVDTLNEEGVDTSLLIKENKEQTGGSVILVTETGERMVLVHRGAASQLDPKDIPASVVADAHWVHLSSIGDQFETLKHIFALVREHGVQLSWNPGSNILEALANGQLAVEELPVTLLLLNKEEWEQVASVHQALLAQIPQIVVTDGSRGGQVFIDGQLAEMYQAPVVRAEDNTGAGDAFAVGYIAAFLHQKELAIRIAWGSNNAASVVQQIGAKAGLLYANTIDI